jgi:excisionase family DNA binding protein
MKAKSRAPGMLTTTEVAVFLHVHPNTVRQWANRGLLHAYRLGPRGDRRFRWEEVETFMDGHKQKSAYLSWTRQ